MWRGLLPSPLTNYLSPSAHPDKRVEQSQEPATVGEGVAALPFTLPGSVTHLLFPLVNQSVRLWVLCVLYSIHMLVYSLFLTPKRLNYLGLWFSKSGLWISNFSLSCSIPAGVYQPALQGAQVWQHGLPRSESAGPWTPVFYIKETEAQRVTQSQIWVLRWFLKVFKSSASGMPSILDLLC
jgi:hypothetical protein